MDHWIKLPGLVVLLLSVVCAQDCRVDVVFQCLRPMLPIYQNITDNLQTGDIRLDYLADTCSEYFAYRRCMPGNCPTPFPDVNHLLNDAFSYVCDDNFRDVESFRSCWENPELREAYLECGIQADETAIREGDACRFYDVMEECADDVTFEHCGNEAAFLVQGYLSLANNQQKRDLDCGTTDTTFDPFPTTFPTPGTPPPLPETTQRSIIDPFPEDAIRCWDCHSGMSRDEHKNCPINGDLVTRLLTSVKCTDACFSKTDRWNKEVIYRGCSTGHWLPKVKSRTGCWEDQELGVIWCFCSSDKCNTQDMTAFLEGPV